MAVLLAEKLGLSLKFPLRLQNRHHHHHLSASLNNFRSKTSEFLAHIIMKPGKGSESESLAWFHNCFELVHATSIAFAELVGDIDYPMSRWGGEATEAYLNYTLILMNMLNSIFSYFSHINQAKISISYGLSLVEKSPSSATKYLKKIPKKNFGRDFRLEGSSGIEIRPGSDQKESVVLQALMVLKKIGFLAIGLVLSGLDSGAKLDLEIGKGPDAPLKKVLESRFHKEVREIESPMEEVNHAVEGLSVAISTERFDEAVRELKGRLDVLENSIQGIEKEVNNLFSEVIASRNKLLDNIRLVGHNS